MCRYLGATARIGTKDYLMALNSILSVEARHASFLRGRVGEIRFGNPFDTPLNFVREMLVFLF